MEANRKNYTNTPWVYQWDDPEEQERYRAHANEIYEQNKSYRNIAMQHQADLSRWLMASLLAVHGGALYLMSGINAQATPALKVALISIASWNIAGIVTALLTGFFAWKNAQYAYDRYDEWADPAMIYRYDKWPKDPETKTDPIGATAFLGAASGLVSGLCFLMGAADLLSALKDIPSKGLF